MRNAELKSAFRIPHFAFPEIISPPTRPERFELPTTGFEVRCSIQLSYGRTERNSSLLSVIPY